MKHTTNAYFQASGMLVLMAVAPLAGAQPPAAPVAPTTPTAPAADAADTSPAHTSYLFGLTFGEQLRNVGVSNKVDQAEIDRGIKDGLKGTHSTRADQQQIQTFVRGVMAESAAQNKQAAKDFLEKNGHDKNVKTTADGLEYKVLVPGNAKAAAVQPTDEVTVQYRGKLLDGTEFDSSYTRGVPATFPANGVIKGWQEALLLMKPGAKWQLFVPPELAYDANPRPGIPPGSLLIFEVELVSAKPAPAGAAGADAAPHVPPSHRAVPPQPTTPSQPQSPQGAPTKPLDQ